MSDSIVNKTQLAALLKEMGVGRISEEGERALVEYIDDIAEEMAQNLTEIVKHGGRVTLKAADVEALKKLC